jgi:hypothetical protein
MRRILQGMKPQNCLEKVTNKQQTIRKLLHHHMPN